MKAITIILSLLLIATSAIHDDANSQLSIEQLHEDNGPTSSRRRIQNGPNAGKRMANWRKSHNQMRRKYHALYNGTYTPIKFNMALKNDAEQWAKQLVKNCVNALPDSTYNPNNYGVNSAMKSGSRSFQNPFTVMKSWENKLKLGYPKNSVMTQVLWSATKYVGCADASSKLNSEKKCTASVCFYAKAGNCAFGRFENWTEAVLYGPACGTACPGNLETC